MYNYLWKNWVDSDVLSEVVSSLASEPDSSVRNLPTSENGIPTTTTQHRDGTTDSITTPTTTPQAYPTDAKEVAKRKKKEGRHKENKGHRTQRQVQ